jgi:predicted nucleic acid-binding protein
MNAIDTNVLIYLFDQDERLKNPIAQAFVAQLKDRDSFTILPWQVAGKLLNWFDRWVKSDRISRADVELHFQDLQVLFPIVVPTPRCLDHYFPLRVKYTLSHWDAMLLAACHEAGVTILYSEDMQSGANYNGVRIINPFLVP